MKRLYTGLITYIYYIDTSVLLENTPLVTFIRNHMRDLSGMFSISSLVKISMISLTSSLFLKLNLNSLLYHWNILGSSSKVFGNLRKFSENVRERWCGPSDKFWRIFGNLQKVLGNLWKIVKNTVISMSIYNKKNVTC